MSMPQDQARLQGAIALTRFGMGARPGEIDAIAGDPKGWLRAQALPQRIPRPAGEFPSANTVHKGAPRGNRAPAQGRSATQAGQSTEFGI
jgi:uncharacterized protein (DUF1800 family)